MHELLPVLVADLIEESARDFLEAVARENDEAWVPLVAPPVGLTPHVLEVYTPSRPEPLRLLAEPTGPPTEHGFPLRLSLPEAGDDAPAELSLASNVEEVAAVGFDVTIAGDLLEAEDDAPTEPPPAPAEWRDPLIGRTLANGKLQIESLIGKGMMGAVYKALHRELRFHVAVKVLHESYQQDADFCRRFYAEALAASQLDHPNLVRVYDFGQEPDGLLYLSMELVDGRSLRDALHAEGPMSVKRIADLMMQVCAGLAPAHARGIIHRDIKPDNIVLVIRQDDDGTPFEQVKVCDFGLALLRASDAQNERFAGTPIYMSPEQCRGDELDARTDVYACGIMMYELATGQPPFLSDKPIVVVNRHLTMQPPPLASLRPDVDPRLEPIVQKTLRKLKEERHESVRALRHDLKTLLGPLHGGFDLAAESARLDEPRLHAPEERRSVAPRSSPTARTPSVPPPSRPSMPVPGPVSSSRPHATPSGSIPPSRSSQSMRAVQLPAPPSAPRAAWLEDTQDSYASFLQDMATGETRAAEVSTSLARDPKTWLTKLLEQPDARVVDRMLGEVEGAAKKLAEQADARTLRAVSTTIHGIATDERRHPAIRQKASAVLRVFADQALLAPVAERFVSRSDDHRDAAKALLLDAGVAGAYAVYGARVKYAGSPSARAPFVEVMRGLGEAAWPVVRAALERIPAAALTGGHHAGAELAEDLLLCVPALPDEAAGHLVAKYVRATEPALCRAATQALGRLWAERAAPVLLALLDVDDDGVRSAAIAGLREVGAVDEDVVRRLVPILTGRDPAGPELRLAAVTALEYVTLDARPVAVPMLVQLVRHTELPDVLALAASKALFSVMGNEARAVLLGRSDVASEPLKSHLLELLKDPELPGVDASDLADLI
ncbi:MAG: serine/threonine protein kinase [Labilithrix sp.]|nr:serine/threonine protein kinase [Labilithrix sp.]